MGTHWKIYKYLGNTFILIICTLPAKERGKCPHFCRSVLIFSVRAVKLRSFKVRMDRVMKTPKYLNPDLESWNGIDGVGIVKAAWLMGRHSLFWMFMCPYIQTMSRMISRLTVYVAYWTLGYAHREVDRQNIAKLCAPLPTSGYQGILFRISMLLKVARWQLQIESGRADTPGTCHEKEEII